MTYSDVLASCTGGTNINAPYSGARVTKLNYEWQPEHYSGDQAVRESWSLLTRRIRDQVRNDQVLTKCKATLSRLGVGTGVLTFSEASEFDSENDSLEAYEIESDTWFERWAEREADVENEHSLWEMHRISFEDVIESGNSIWLKTLLSEPGRTVPLAYQLIEWEQIDMTQDRERSVSRGPGRRVWNRISNGIEYDENNRKVAFHLFDVHPYDQTTGWTALSRAIPAERVLHYYHPIRPSAKLGVTWFAPQLQGNHDLDKFVANELTTRALTALLGVAIKTNDKNATSGFEAEDVDTGLPQFKLGYPYIGMLKRDDEIEVIESKRDTKDAQALINLLLNLQAMGCRISLNRLLGDPSRANLASIKAAWNDDDAMIAPIQGEFARRVVIPIRREHNMWAINRRVIKQVTPRDYEARRFLYDTFSVVTGQRNDMDVDDVIAAIDRMRSGQSTYQEECARRGRHWRRNLRRMKAVNDAARKLGVVLDWTKGQGQNPDSATSIAGDEKQQGAGAGNASGTK